MTLSTTIHHVPSQYSFITAFKKICILLSTVDNIAVKLWLPFTFPFVCWCYISILYFGGSNFFSFFVFFSPCITSAPIPFFHRCAPVNISCYAKFAEALITFVSDNSVLHRLISGVMTSKEIIIGLCFLSLGNGFSDF